MNGVESSARLPVAAIVPALNEEMTIGRVVAEAAAAVDLVVVVDDGSTDRTAELARAAGAIVVSHPTNRGVGGAISTGLRTALEHGAGAIVQIDGDGQHDANFVTSLIAALGRGNDVVVGTRFEAGFEMGRVRRFVLGAFGRVISRSIGVEITDPTSGFRAFSRVAAERLGPIFPTKYLSDTVEVLYLAHEHGLSIETVPVEMRPRAGGTPSVGLVTGALYTLRMIWIVAVHTFRSPRRGVRVRPESVGDVRG